MRGYFAQVRRAGFNIGLSTGKLTRAMVEVLSQLPPEVAPSKEVVAQHLGLLGQMSKTRDINAAWNSAKRQVVRQHPDRFCLDGKVLRWVSDIDGRLREKLSTAGHRRLAALAAKEGMTPDELLGHLIATWRRAKMIALGQLQVRVNDALVLDAGICEGVQGPHGWEISQGPCHPLLAITRLLQKGRPSGFVGSGANMATIELVGMESRLACTSSCTLLWWAVAQLVAQLRAGFEGCRAGM